MIEMPTGMTDAEKVKAQLEKIVSETNELIEVCASAYEGSDAVEVKGALMRTFSATVIVCAMQTQAKVIASYFGVELPPDAVKVG